MSSGLAYTLVFILTLPLCMLFIAQVLGVLKICHLEQGTCKGVGLGGSSHAVGGVLHGYIMLHASGHNSYTRKDMNESLRPLQ